MAVWSPSNIMLTQKGQEVLSKVQVGEDSLKITKVVTGSGRVAVKDLFALTGVSNICQQVEVKKVSTMSTGSVLELQVSNSNLSASYTVNQIGVYATHPDTGEILYMIAQCDENTGDIIPLPTVTPVTMHYSLYLIHSKDTQLDISVNDTGYVSYKDFDEHVDYSNQYTKDEVTSIAPNVATPVSSMRSSDLTPEIVLSGVTLKSTASPSPDAPATLTSVGSPVTVTVADYLGASSPYTIPLKDAKSNTYDLKGIDDNCADKIEQGIDSVWSLKRNVVEFSAWSSLIAGVSYKSANLYDFTFSLTGLSFSSSQYGFFTHGTWSIASGEAVAHVYMSASALNSAAGLLSSDPDVVPKVITFLTNQGAKILAQRETEESITLSDEAQTSLNNLKVALSYPANGKAITVTSVTNLDIISRSIITQNKQENNLTDSQLSSLLSAMTSGVNLNGVLYPAVNHIITVPAADGSHDGYMSSAQSNKLTGIENEANKYVHPTTSGNKHIPAGGASGQSLMWSADGTAQWQQLHYVFTATLTASGWSSTAPYKQTISFADMTVTMYPHVDLIPANGNSPTVDEEEAFACLTGGTTANGTVTFECRSDKPEITFTVRLEVNL